MRSRDRHTYEAHGDVYYITSTVVGFVNLFEREDICRIFIDCVDFCQRRGDFALLAWVLMPNHFHLILKRSDTHDISTIIGGIKRYTSRTISAKLHQLGMGEMIAALEQAALREPSSDSTVWKPRFDSLVITNEETLRQKIEYIHFNPVKKALVAEPTEWRYSSASAHAGIGDPMLQVDTGWQCIGYQKEPSGKDS